MNFSKVAIKLLIKNYSKKIELILPVFNSYSYIHKTNYNTLTFFIINCMGLYNYV